MFSHSCCMESGQECKRRFVDNRMNLMERRQACSLWQIVELGFANEPVHSTTIRKPKIIHCFAMEVLPVPNNLQISAKHGCLDTGSSSKGAGT